MEVAFGELARLHSEDQPTRYRGGDCGWVSRDRPIFRWPPKVLDAMFALQTPGELSPVIEAEDGCYLIKLIDAKPAQITALGEVREAIEKRLTQQAVEQRQADFNREALAGLRVELHPDLLEKITRRRPLPATVPSPRPPCRRGETEFYPMKRPSSLVLPASPRPKGDSAGADPADPRRLGMPRRSRALACLFIGTLMMVGAMPGRSLASQLATQTFTLHPGWNAIYLEVAPENSATSAVFDGIPVDSVWTFQAQLSAVQFIQDPKEPVWDKSRWAVYVPTNRVESFQNNLFSVQANRAYLVNLSGASPATLSVTGRPSLRRSDWVPNAYNLCGFPVDPAALPTFLAFFGPSPAHYDRAAGRLQPIYR